MNDLSKYPNSVIVGVSEYLYANYFINISCAFRDKEEKSNDLPVNTKVNNILKWLKCADKVEKPITSSQINAVWLRDEFYHVCDKCVEDIDNPNKSNAVELKYGNKSMVIVTGHSATDYHNNASNGIGGIPTYNANILYSKTATKKLSDDATEIDDLIETNRNSSIATI